MLGSKEIDFYKSEGYLVVEGVLSKEEIEGLRQVSDEWVEASRNVSQNDAKFDLEPAHTRDKPALRRIFEPAKHSKSYGDIMAKPEILDIVEQLIGPNIRGQGSKLNMKSAGIGSPVEWHQDWGFYPHTNDDLLAVGVAIDDMTTENGCLLVVPGSHKGPILDHNSEGYFVGSVEPKLIDMSSAVPLVGSAGSITLHHVRMLHASAPNTSGQPRRLFLIMLGAGDAWPLIPPKNWHDTQGWDAFAETMLRGEATTQPRMEAVPVRLPLPRSGDRKGSIYEVQGADPNRRTNFAKV